MKLTIEKQDLLNLATVAASVVASRNTMPILGNVLLNAASGELKATATDLDRQIDSKAPAHVSQSGLATVDAKLLHGIAKAIEDGALIEASTDNGYLHIFLKVGLKQRYRNCDRIQFPVVAGADKSEIFWMQHGENLIAAHHGDKAKPEKLAMIIADQCGFWSNTRHRVILTGHLHHLRTLDMPGVTHYTMRAFSPPDAYGANFGGVRGLQVMTFCPKHGLIAQTHDGVWRE